MRPNNNGEETGESFPVSSSPFFVFIFFFPRLLIIFVRAPVFVAHAILPPGTSFSYVSNLSSVQKEKRQRDLNQERCWYSAPPTE